MFDADLSGNMLNFHLLRRLMHWLKPYRVSVAASGLLVLVASTLQVLLPVIISIVVIDHIIQGGADGSAPDLGMVATVEWLSAVLGAHPLAAACVLYGGLQVGWAFTGHAHRMTLASAVTKALRDLRLDLFRHLETRPASFYDHVAVGRVMTRVTNDIEALYELLSGIGALIGEFVPFFVALLIMFSVDAELTGILLLAMPVMGLATYVFRRATRKLFRLGRQAVSALNQNMQENLAGLQVVQLSGREQRNLAQYRDINAKNLGYERTAARWETLYGALNDSLSHIAIGVILYYGAGPVIQEQLSLGAVVLFTRFVDMLLHPIVVLGEQTNVLFRAMASGERIFQAIDWDEKIHEPSTPAVLPKRLAGAVEFRSLHFAYKADEPVLRDLSFSIAPGEKLAIVGPTGSGKSTLIRLLSRFYDFDDGCIFLDGIDIKQIHTRDLRRRIGVVLQDFHIFSGSIADNIALGNPAIARPGIVKAAQTVNARGFIEALPQGFDTQLSERGQNLSQGQRQLLAFARVLAADPEILVLDEATASIDTETEHIIQEALGKVTAARTSILIAHRLQTVEQADRVLVMDQGRIAEIGSHQELLTRGGLYYRLHSLQFQDIDRRRQPFDPKGQHRT